MSLRCTFCEKEFPAPPADAVKVGKASGSTQMYQFSDGSVHNLVSTKTGRKAKKEQMELPALGRRGEVENEQSI